MSDTPSNSAGAEAAGPLQQIYDLIGGRPVLLPIPKGTKGPAFARWQQISWEHSQGGKPLTEMRDALPGEKLATGKDRLPLPPRPYHELLVERAAAGNIGVLLGEPSVLTENGRTWHLCSIDIDDTAAVDAFIAENPKLAFTLQTCGARGRNLWLWIEGPYPKLAKGLCWLALEDHDSTVQKGKWIKKGDADPDHPFGEWRATGGQTVFAGTHPSGCAYRWLVKKPPVRVTFDEINWPKSIHLPWVTPELPPDEAAIAAEDAKKQSALIERYGVPWVIDDGRVTVNQPFFAGYFAAKHRILYSPEEGRFWRYQGDSTGLWIKQTEDNIRAEMAADIKEVADGAKQTPLIMVRTTGMMSSIVGMLRGQVERYEAFKRPVSDKTQRPRALIHCQNGMLDLDESPPVVRAFSEAHLSRHQLAVALREGAECPRFMEFLGNAVCPEDIELMQKFAGQILIGVNYAQKLLILTGTAGGGKGTFVSILQKIIGERNVGELRTEHLAKQFEMYRLHTKSLVVGVDVPGDFLQAEGAYKIKALTGGDLMTAEAKLGNDEFQFRGELNVLITCNSRLKVDLDSYAGAYGRRLAIVDFRQPPPAHPDPHFVMKLLASEASGILNWIIAGAVKLLKDLEETGRMTLTKLQRDRVDSLLAESDSIRDFVKRGCAKTAEARVTSDQLVQAYVRYCEDRGWNPESVRVVERELPDILLEVHRATKANDIKVDGDPKAKRGFRGVEILTHTEEAGDGLL